MVPTLDSETLAIYLIGHGAKEGWKSLGWVCDVAAFYVRAPEVDWAGHFHRLDRGDRMRLQVGLLLATKLLGVRVREDVLNDACGDAKVGSQLAFALRRLACAAEPMDPRADFSLAGAGICRGFRERARALWLLAVTRTASDYNAIPLPRPLWRLYHLIRPFRLAFKIWMLRIEAREQKQSSRLAAHPGGDSGPRMEALRDDLGRG